MEIAEHIDALAAEGRRLADAAAAAGLDADVPPCPGWDVRALVTHIGGIHRWAARHVRDGHVPEAEVEGLFEAPDDLLDWFRAGHDDLVAALRAADPAAERFTFLPAPSSLAFWARRQAHETAIHRVDAEAAAGDPTGFAPGFAADGVAELIEGFMSRGGPKLACDPPRSLAIRVTDVPGYEWTIRFHADGNTTTSGAGPAGATVSGHAADLYPFLWNRTDASRVRVDGDPAVLAHWRDHANVRWS